MWKPRIQMLGVIYTLSPGSLLLVTCGISAGVGSTFYYFDLELAQGNTLYASCLSTSINLTPEYVPAIICLNNRWFTSTFSEIITNFILKHFSTSYEAQKFSKIFQAYCFFKELSDNAIFHCVNVFLQVAVHSRSTMHFD